MHALEETGVNLENNLQDDHAISVRSQTNEAAEKYNNRSHSKIGRLIYLHIKNMLALKLQLQLDD